jgi:pyruvate formate lyase activating enzyme
MTQQHVVHAPSSHGQLTGYIHSTESGAGVDGPGMRFVYFMSGCQFRCQYCHNPDTWKLHAGRQLTVEQALAEVAPYAGFLKFAGGVTISGGEPLMQAEFVGALFTAIKQRYGLHTALDTQGFCMPMWKMPGLTRSIWCCWISSTATRSAIWRLPARPCSRRWILPSG